MLNLVCVVLLSQPSNRDLVYVKSCVCCVICNRDCVCYMLCVLFCYLSPVTEIWCMLHVVCVVLLSQPSNRDLVYVKYCVCCVISAQCLNVVCVVLSQPSNRDLVYVKSCVCCPVISAQ